MAKNTAWAERYSIHEKVLKMLKSIRHSENEHLCSFVVNFSKRNPSSTPERSVTQQQKQCFFLLFFFKLQKNLVLHMTQLSSSHKFGRNTYHLHAHTHTQSGDIKITLYLNQRQLFLSNPVSLKY